MASTLTDPVLLAGTVLGTAGTVLVLHARLQSRLLRRRIAAGEGTEIVDPATGLFSSKSAWQCIRAESNRAHRLGRSLDMWIATAGDVEALDTLGKELTFSMPAGATGVRLSERSLCVLTCAGPTDLESLVADLAWTKRTFPAGDETAQHALAFVTEVSSDG